MTEATTTLLAQPFGNAALPGRTVVRVVEATRHAAAEIEMDVLGFTPLASTAEVGTAPRRAIGFPTWALIHHPAEARFALALTREMRVARSRVRTKPGHARDAFAALARKLEASVPAFLPSFWEEAARAFLAEDNTSYAAQCFEKARAAERAFHLTVNEDERAEAYLELALAGAVPSKTLAGYADDLVAAYGAKDGERRFRELNQHRIAGGLTPYAGLAKTLRKLAKEAGRKPDEADDDFVRAVLDAPALARAPVDFWTTYRASFERLMVRDERAKARLVWLFPEPKGGSKGVAALRESWLGLLLAHDATATVAASRRSAAWLDALASFVAGDAYNDEDIGPLSPDVFRLLEAAAPAVRAEGVPLSLDTMSDRSFAGEYLPDLVEAALALGLPLAAPRRVEGEWPDEPTLLLDRPFAGDFPLIAAHPHFGKLLDKSVSGRLGDERFEERAKGKPALGAVRRRALQGRVDELGRAGLQRFVELAGELSLEIPASVWAEFPEALAAARASKAAKPLAEALRTGLLDELSWPAFEAAVRELAPKHEDRSEIEITGTTNHAVLRRGQKVIVFEGSARLTTLDLPARPKCTLGDVMWLDGDLLVPFRDQDYDAKAAWANTPNDVFAGDFTVPSGHFDLALPGGGVSLGRLPIRRGDVLRGNVGRDFVSDGTMAWVLEGGRGDDARLRLLELDTSKGTTGRASWPAFAIEPSERADGRSLERVTAFPAPAGTARSPLGSAGACVGWLVRRTTRTPNGSEEARWEVIRIDGASAESTTAIDALLDVPGGGAPVRLATSAAWSATDDDAIEFVDANGQAIACFGEGRWPSFGFGRLPRWQMLCFCTPRDEAGSRALRTLDDELAEALLKAARLDLPTGDADDGDDDDDDDDELPPLVATEAAFVNLLPDLRDSSLRRSASHYVRMARQGERALERLAAGAEQDRGKTNEDEPDDEAVEAALFVALREGYDDGRPCADLQAIGQFFRTGETRALTGSSIAWERSIESLPKLLAFLASREATPEKHRRTIVALLRAIRTSGLLGLTLTRATIKLRQDHPLTKRPKRHDTWLLQDGEMRGFARMTDEADEDDKDELHTIALVAYVPAPHAFTPPKDAEIVRQESVKVPDTSAFLDAFFDELARRDPAPLDEAAVTLIAAGEVLKPAEARYLLAGLPKGADEWAHDFLGKEMRARLGLKVNEAKAAKEAFARLREPIRVELLATAFDVAEPSGFWAAADEPRGLAQTLAAAVRKTLGARRAVPDELQRALERDLSVGLGADEIVDLLLDEASPRLLPRVGAAFDELEDDGALNGDVLAAAAYVLPWLAWRLPVGDELRSSAPRLHARLASALGTERLLLRAGYRWIDNKKKRAAFFEAIGGEATTLPPNASGEALPARDDGLVLAVDEGDGSIALAFRPARLTSDADRARLVALTTDDDDDGDGDGGDDGNQTVTDVVYLLSAACVELVRTIADESAPPGSYAGNPRISAPAVVDEVKQTYHLDEDAAVLYLQVLALPAPTQKLVCQWNDWSPARYKKAVEALLACQDGLVVLGKREGAGRTVFLPGAWAKGGGSTYESWKQPLFAGGDRLLEAPASLYARAYARVKRGDAPRFETTKAITAAAKQSTKTKTKTERSS